MPQSDFLKHRGHGSAELNWPVLIGVAVVILLIFALTLL